MHWYFTKQELIDYLVNDVDADMEFEVKPVGQNGIVLGLEITLNGPHSYGEEAENCDSERASLSVGTVTTSAGTVPSEPTWQDWSARYHTIPSHWSRLKVLLPKLKVLK